MPLLFIITLCFLLIACDAQVGNPSRLIAPAINAEENNPGGESSVSFQPFPSFQLPAANIANELRPDFYAGQALANQPWVKAPTITTARDGLGPIYNARTCLTCHVKGGKGFIPADNKTTLTSTLVRLSTLPTFSTLETADQLHKLKISGSLPNPIYGDQIQSQSVSLAHQLRHSQKPGTLKHDVAPEAYIHINWQEKIFTYPDQHPDQHTVSLRSPELDFKYLGYGDISSVNNSAGNKGSVNEGTVFSLRVAPMIHGMGLISLISDEDILALSDENDSNQDGISGRPNQVWDVEKQITALGRFGLKSNKPTLEMIVAGAFTNDLGITNSLEPNQPCTELQPTCLNMPDGNDEEGVELPDHLLKLVVNFNRNLAPVIRRNPGNKNVLAGRELFYQSGCQQCHNPSFTTQKSTEFPHLSEQRIWPYSDFLLHDMGPDLADGRPDFLATGNEWRTPPLWGIGLLAQVNGMATLLHDGRARSVEEAIIWHGGEAELAKNRFVLLDKQDRDRLIQFVNSL